jgi:ferritin-like metal-binding protein YciE
MRMLDGLIDEAKDDTLKLLLRIQQEETRGHVGNIEQVFAVRGRSTTRLAV